MIKPVLKNDALLADIHATPKDDGNFYLWWLGQSGYLIQWEGHHLLIDPYLSDSLTKKYAETDKPHVRMTELVIDPSNLDFIEVVTSSHNHTDHLDGETLIPLIQANPDIKMIIPEANRTFVANRIHMPANFPIGLDAGEQTTQSVFTFHAIPAAHEELEKDEAGRYKFLGYVVQFGPWTIYHSGDTLLYEGMEDWLKPFSIDLAILPINGRNPNRRVAGNLNDRQAVDLAKNIHARMLIPCHYEMFTFNTADPTAFAFIAATEQQPFQVIECGERWSSASIPDQ